ncbi:hypothetical protein B296_00001401 [Ensete ventricosum]|uniref:Uncharacterized protein n=1 Tax=Ensete ventricosum TaxID=4639 RepID=A0A427AMQ4_ENSVE|nr:hypothetical protein B296_00001401 [Ensete ventricosum]
MVIPPSAFHRCLHRRPRSKHFRFVYRTNKAPLLERPEVATSQSSNLMMVGRRKSTLGWLRRSLGVGLDGDGSRTPQSCRNVMGFGSGLQIGYEEHSGGGEKSIPKCPRDKAWRSALVPHCPIDSSRCRCSSASASEDLDSMLYGSLDWRAKWRRGLWILISNTLGAVRLDFIGHDVIDVEKEMASIKRRP